MHTHHHPPFLGVLRTAVKPIHSAEGLTMARSKKSDLKSIARATSNMMAYM